MARYIDMNELLHAIDKRNGCLPLWLDEILMVDCKVADVAPVVHGRWYMRGGRACCSNCNVKSLWGSDWDGNKNHEREFVSAKSNYCPNCGAKMDVNKVE